MSSTIITPTTPNSNNNTNSTNGIHNAKTNRTLFKNIKNNAPTTPNLKNIIGNGPTTTTTTVANTPTNVNSKKNNNSNNEKNNKNNKNILFTPSSKTSMVSSKAVSRDDSFLDIASIEKDLKGMEVFIGGGISPCQSPSKESSSSTSTSSTSVPITIVDLESSSSSTNTVCQTTTKPSIKYSVDLLLSFKSANTKRPDEIDIVEIDQRNIVVPLSLPTTPYNSNNNNSNHNNNNNNSSINNTSVNGHKNPIFSPQISPFKIAYSQTTSISSNSKTPTKRTNNNNVTTPQSINSSSSSYQNNNNNVKSSTKKLNPIPFSLNTPNTQQKTTPKKSNNNNSTINTPKSNKKVNEVAAAFAAAATATATDVDSSTTTATVNETSSDQSPKKVPLRETDEKRLKARQRQIDIGKMTAGYKNYIALIPKSKRKPTDPKTPNKYQVCSKRSWDGQIKKWRRQLHENFDWTGVPFNEKEVDSTLNETTADDDNCTVKLEKVFNQLEISSTTTVEN